MLKSGKARKPDTKVTKICEYCNGEYRRNPYAAETSQFCTKRCKDLANITVQDIVCAECGTPIKKHPCNIKSHNFCSRSCSSTWFAKPRKNRVTKMCVICGDEYTCKARDAKKSVACSTHCNAINNCKKQGGHKRTSIEIKVDDFLNELSISHECQYVVNNKFVADFYIPRYNIIVEAYGDYWHANPREFKDNLNDMQIAKIKSDQSRIAYLTACGYKVFIIWEADINADLTAAMAPVLQYIHSENS